MRSTKGLIKQDAGATGKEMVMSFEQIKKAEGKLSQRDLEAIEAIRLECYPDAVAREEDGSFIRAENFYRYEWQIPRSEIEIYEAAFPKRPGERTGKMEKIEPSLKVISDLAHASGIDCADDTLWVVCRQAIIDGEGTPERVREIWAEAELELEKEDENENE